MDGIYPGKYIDICDANGNWFVGKVTSCEPPAVSFVLEGYQLAPWRVLEDA